MSACVRSKLLYRSLTLRNSLCHGQLLGLVALLLVFLPVDSLVWESLNSSPNTWQNHPKWMVLFRGWYSQVVLEKRVKTWCERVSCPTGVGLWGTDDLVCLFGCGGALLLCAHAWPQLWPPCPAWLISSVCVWVCVCVGPGLSAWLISMLSPWGTMEEVFSVLMCDVWGLQVHNHDRIQLQHKPWDTDS